MSIGSGARTPEELELLFEDALIVRDAEMLGALFEPGSTLVTGEERPARGGVASARQALATWNAAHPYLAEPRHIVMARDIALIDRAPGVNVVRRNLDGTWYFVIVWQAVARTTGKARS